MNNINIDIWGRHFNLPISFEQYDGEELTSTQKKAVEKLECCEHSINESITHIEKYILNNGLIHNGFNKVDNIFKYVIPKDIYVMQDKKRKVAILCNYKFDMEHGLAIVFENEKFKTMGAQDIIL